jgi:hypothetical protein
MDAQIAETRRRLVEKILDKQDDLFRWRFNEKQARERPEYLYYSPNFTSTLWTLILLADLQSPPDTPQIKAAIQLITDYFYDAEHGVFGFSDKSHFPIPCLNGNMIYLHHYFGMAHAEALDRVVSFFAAHQRFDDGDFKTPDAYPYCGNKSCYGRHTCYWGVTKLLKGVSFIPPEARTAEAQRLIENCLEFVLHHEVCFSSHHRERLLHPTIGVLTFPNFYKSDFLELLWLLMREGVQDRRLSRALELLRLKMKDGGFWELEKSLNSIVSIGPKDRVNAFVTERAAAVMRHYGE